MSTKTKVKAVEQFPLETRTITTKEGDFQFQILTLKSPDDWKPATEFVSHETVQIRGSNRPLSLKIRGLSYREWEKIEFELPMPRWTSEEPYPAGGDKEFEDQKNLIQRQREVQVLEIATGIKVPGNTLAEKVQSIQMLGAGESNNLFWRILEYQSGFDGGPLETAYESAVANSNGHAGEAISKFEDWLAVSQGGTFFRMQRQFEDFLIEIPMKQLSEARHKEIESECGDPTPPSKPGKNPMTGKVDPAFPVFNYSDSGYLAKVKAVNRKKRVLLLDATLPFPIPGTTIDEKFEWLGDRLLGDVNRIVNYIDNNLLNYRGRFDFFTKNSGPPN